MARNQFFQKIDNEWERTSSLRSSYDHGIPLPNSKYFEPIHSIDECAQLLVRPIEKPLWLGLNAIGYLLKAILTAVAALVVTPIAIIANIIAPRSNFTHSINSAFCSAAANAITSVGMCLLAAVSTLASLIFNPLYLVSRCVGTVFDRIHDMTDSGHSSSVTFSF